MLGPAGDIEQSSGRKEVEAGLGERHSVLTLETLVELRLELMQITDIARGIIALRITELVGPPVAGLLRLGQIDVEQLLHQVLQPMTVGVSRSEERRVGKECRSRWL